MLEQLITRRLEKLLTSYVAATKVERLTGVVIHEDHDSIPSGPYLSIRAQPDFLHSHTALSPTMWRAEMEICLHSQEHETEQAVSVSHWLTELIEVLTVGPVGSVTVDSMPNALALFRHGFQEGDEVSLTTTGELPGNLAPGLIYYVREHSPDAFGVAATAGGEALDFTLKGGRGTHTVRGAGSEFACLLSRAKDVPLLNLEGVYLMETMTGMEGDRWVASVTLRMEGAILDPSVETQLCESHG